MPSTLQTPGDQDSMLVLGIDTCGPTGSVALGRAAQSELDLLGETTLEGRTYSATLVAAVGELLSTQGVGLREIGCIVVVNGPGSFTGVRVGVSAAKGLGEGGDIPVIAVSRLEVLANKSGLADVALDAHRHEVYLRIGGIERLAGAAELTAIDPVAERVGVCEAEASALLAASWPAAKMISVPPPTASDALRVAMARIGAGEFDDISGLDGHYLRRSDAEIFGDPASAPAKSA